MINNKFAASLFYLNEFCKSSDVIQFPIIKIVFKTKRELTYFEAHFRKNWLLEFGIPPTNLDKFKMMGFDVELILE